MTDREIRSCHLTHPYIQPGLLFDRCSISMSSSADALKLVLANLSTALTFADEGNIRTNAKLWDRYADNYFQPTNESTSQSNDQSANDQSTKPSTVNHSEWVLTMASQVGRDASKLQTIGDEWSDEQSLIDTLSSYLYPFLDQSMVVGELGSGGGRCAVKVAPLVNRWVGFDISSGMINQCKQSLKQSNHVNTELHLLPINQSNNQRPTLPKQFNQTFDFFYCFDVFVHCDLHTIYGYLLSIKQSIKPSGKVFISTSNLNSPLGWDRFEHQTRYSEAGFYFVTPDMVRLLIDKAGFQIIKESQPDPNSPNMYINRDYLVVMELKQTK